MNAAEWEQIKSLFDAALAMPPEQRLPWLQETCRDRRELLETVLGVLRNYEESSLMGLPDPAPDPVFSPGQIVADRFLILRLIARGGMGEVYEARDRQLNGLRVALKTLRLGLVAEQQAHQRFKREVWVAREIVHEGVCRVYDLIEHRIRQTDGTELVVPCLTMKLLEGESLADYLKSRRPLTADHALPIVQQVGRALKALHGAGIVHRDLKPSNVMLLGADEQRRVVLIDFGLAKPLGEGEDAWQTRADDLAPGAPYFLAPEILRGQKASVATDLYALGLLMDTMVTRTAAFPHSSIEELYFRKLHTEPEAPSARSDNLPAHWEHLILRCLSPDPQSRPESVAAVLASLENPDIGLTQLQQREAPPVAQSSHLGSESRPRFYPKRLLWVGLAVALAVVVAFAVLSPDVFSNPGSQRRPVGRLLWRITSEAYRGPSFPLPGMYNLGTASADGMTLFAARSGDKEVLQIDPRSGSYRAIEIGARVEQMSIVPGESKLLIAAGSAGLVLVDLAGRSAPKRFDVGGGVSEAISSKDAKWFYLAMERDGVRRMNARSGDVEVITRSVYAHRVALSPDGRHLVVTYQGSKPGGHDRVEVFDVGSGRLLHSISGPPLVGGVATVSPLDGSIWLDAQDACVNPEYDHAGCPTVPTALIQVFQSPDYKLRFSWPWAIGPTGGEPLFLGEGQKVAVAAGAVRVLDASRLKLLESWSEPRFLLGHSASGDTVHVQDPAARLSSIQVEDSTCEAVPQNRNEFYAFDGSLEGALENKEFRPTGEVRFIPGFVGQCLRLGQDGEIRVRPSSQHRFGEFDTSLVFWVRLPPKSINSKLFRRQSATGTTRFALDTSGDRLRIHGIWLDVLSGTFSTGTWHQVAITCARDRTAVYVDGKPKLEAPIRGSVDVSTEDDFLLGGKGSTPFDVDELMTFERAITGDEISGLYSLRTTGTCKP